MMWLRSLVTTSRGRFRLLRVAGFILPLVTLGLSIVKSLGAQQTAALTIVSAVVGYLGPYLADKLKKATTEVDPSLSDADMARLEKEHRDDLLGSVGRVISPALKPPLGEPPLTLGLQVGANGNADRGAAQPLNRVDAIRAAYDRAGSQLVVLGAPGAGKSLLLYQLAEQLRETAAENPGAAIPVIVDMNTWSQSTYDFDDWLVGQLARQNYSVDKPAGWVLVKGEKVVPLLDGLDQIDDKALAGCVASINRFRGNKHGQMPMVVSSRLEEYRAIGTAVGLRAEAVVEPLSKQDLVDCLRKRDMQPLADMLDQDQELVQLLSTPEFLTFAVMAYGGKSTESIPTGTLEERRKALLAGYVQARLASPEASNSTYAPERTTACLSWLASQLTARHEGDCFYPDLLQPDWLGSRSHRLAATYGLAVAVGGFVGLLALLANAPLFGRWAIGLAVIGGLTAGLAAFDTTVGPTSRLTLSWRRWGSHAKGWLMFGPLFGLLAGLTVGLIARLQGGLVGTLGVLISGLIAGACLGLFFALVGIIETRPFDAPTGPGRAIESSKRNAIVGGSFLALSAALIAGVGGGLIVELGVLPPNLRPDLAAWLVPALILQGVAFGLVFASALGWDPGIRIGEHGARLRTGLIVALGVGLVDVQVGLLMSGQWGGLGNMLNARLGGPNAKGILAGILLAILVGVGTGIVHGLLRGGSAYLRHGAVVGLLQREGVVAPRYLEFLAYASRINLLQRKGGGYRFANNSLMEHFAKPAAATQAPNRRP